MRPRRARRQPGTVKCPACKVAVDAARADCPLCRGPLPDAPPARRAPVHHEDRHMQALHRWALYQQAAIPELALLAHWPNGGERGELEAWRMKGQGTKSGPPDWYLDVARGGFFGLRIELKPTREDLGGRKPWVRHEQREWIRMLREQGYYAVVCEGWEAARDALLAYLRQPRTVATAAPALPMAPLEARACR